MSVFFFHIAYSVTVVRHRTGWITIEKSNSHHWWIDRSAFGYPFTKHNFTSHSTRVNACELNVVCVCVWRYLFVCLCVHFTVFERNDHLCKYSIRLSYIYFYVAHTTEHLCFASRLCVSAHIHQHECTTHTHRLPQQNIEIVHLFYQNGDMKFKRQKKRISFPRHFSSTLFLLYVQRTFRVHSFVRVCECVRLFHVYMHMVQL